MDECVNSLKSAQRFVLGPRSQLEASLSGLP